MLFLYLIISLSGNFFIASVSLLVKSNGVTSDMVLIDVYGNSMEPELKDGDTVLIDTSQKEILAGSIYAVGIDDTIRDTQSNYILIGGRKLQPSIF